MANKNTIIKDALVLFGITLFAGVALGFVYDITRQPIVKAELQAKTQAYQSVFLEADRFRETKDLNLMVKDSDHYILKGNLKKVRIEEAVEAVDKDGALLGYVFSTVSEEGYAGDIKISMGIDTDGKVKGIAFLVLKETPGLGAKAESNEFKSQFDNKKVTRFLCTKSGAKSENEIDALTGATITSNAVTNAVNAGICFYEAVSQ